MFRHVLYVMICVVKNKYIDDLIIFQLQVFKLPIALYGKLWVLMTLDKCALTSALVFFFLAQYYL